MINYITSEHSDLVALGIKAIVVLIIGTIVIKITMMLAKRLLWRIGVDPALHNFLIIAFRIVLWVIFLIIILSVLNIPTAPMVTVLGAIGAAIAIALKDSLSNVAAGIIILFNKPILRGEIVELEGKDTIGVVDSIDLFATHMRTFDNRKITVPNNIIVNTVVLNHTREGKRRVDCRFIISYKDDISNAKNILAKVADSCETVLKDEEYIIGVFDMTEDGVTLDLKAWCLPEDYFDVKYFFEENVKLAFDEAGIEIPYRQLDVRIRR